MFFSFITLLIIHWAHMLAAPRGSTNMQSRVWQQTNHTQLPKPFFLTKLETYIFYGRENKCATSWGQHPDKSLVHRPHSIYLVEPLNKGHLCTEGFAPYSEVVPYWEVSQKRLNIDVKSPLKNRELISGALFQ